MKFARAIAIGALFAACLDAGRAAAQVPAGCYEVCGTGCLKPISVADRWDDVAPIPGYTGGTKGRPNWANNGQWDQEAFTDLNQNGLYDLGEPFIDGNGNGVHDAEVYGSLSTGLVADATAGNTLAPNGDVGRELTLNPALSTVPVLGAFEYIDLPPVNKGAPVTGGSQFRDNWANCNASLVEPADRLQVEVGLMVGPTNQAMRDLIAQDPNAYWDPITQSVQGSAFALSPRIILVTAYDPRVAINSGTPPVVVVTKVIPAFMEQMTGNAAVLVRLMREPVTGTTCPGASAGGWLYACATPASTTSWGRVKATYR